MNLIQVPVVGVFTYRDADETPAAFETIHFIAVSRAVVDGETITLPKKLSFMLDANGEVPDTFTLPTVGDGVYYKVKERFSGGRSEYIIQVLTTDTEIDLATIAPVVPPEDLASTRGPGVAKGGTTDQKLVKASNADYDTKWVDDTGGGGSGQFSIMTASVNPVDGGLYIETVEPAGDATPVFTIDTDGNLGVTL